MDLEHDIYIRRSARENMTFSKGFLTNLLWVKTQILGISDYICSLHAEFNQSEIKRVSMSFLILNTTVPHTEFYHYFTVFLRLKQ